MPGRITKRQAIAAELVQGRHCETRTARRSRVAAALYGAMRYWADRDGQVRRVALVAGSGTTVYLGATPVALFNVDGQYYAIHNDCPHEDGPLGEGSLCGSVVFGFHALQLVSPEPCRPFDLARRGISIGEAAAFALLERGAGGYAAALRKRPGRS